MEPRDSDLQRTEPVGTPNMISNIVTREPKALSSDGIVVALYDNTHTHTHKCSLIYSKTKEESDWFSQSSYKIAAKIRLNS